MSRRIRRPVQKTRRRPALQIRRRVIVQAQQELLKWCPNVAEASATELEYTCWACGYRGKTQRTRCHIVPYREGETESPDNFILLCDACHRDQPDGLCREVLKYWLYTRESVLVATSHKVWLLVAAIEAMKEEFGDRLVDLALDEITPRLEQKVMERYAQSTAGGARGNFASNSVWGPLQDIYAWCAQGRLKVEVNPSDAIEISRQLGRAGADLASLHERIDTSTPTGRFFSVVMAALPTMEREQTALRTSDAMKRHQSRGRRMTRPDRVPFGYRTDLADPKRLVEEMGEQRIMSTIVEMSKQEISEIAVALDSAGHSLRSGRPWNTRSGRALIRSILARKGTR